MSNAPHRQEAMGDGRDAYQTTLADLAATLAAIATPSVIAVRPHESGDPRLQANRSAVDSRLRGSEREKKDDQNLNPVRPRERGDP